LDLEEKEDPVTEEGIVEILGVGRTGIDAVMAKIDAILFKPEVGSVYEVKVIKMLDFGAVVELGNVQKMYLMW